MNKGQKKSKNFSRNMINIGDNYNSWTIIRHEYQGNWLCRCVCGTEKIVDGYTLIKGTSRQCHICGNKERSSKLKIGGDHVAAKQAYAKSRAQAKERGFEYNLSFDFFYSISKKDCYYCNSSPEGGYWENSSYKKDWHEAFISNGIDRFDNLIGYLEENVVPCCIRCNRAKNNMSIKEWKEKIIQWNEWLNKYMLDMNSNKEV